MVYNNVTELIGKTPLAQISKMKKEERLKANIFLKLEYFNPAGSIKDRASLFMIEGAIKEGIIKEGATIIESTSGNTGIGLAMVGAYYNFKVILTMPDTMSIERRKILSAYGAEIVLTDGKLGMAGAIKKAEELKNSIPNSFIPSQFDNSDNIKSHYETTAPEIWYDTNGNVDIVVSSFGTGGTISGIGRFLKEQNKNIKIIGVEPFDSPLITKGFSGAHKIQGIGANFVPENLDKKVVDDYITATTEESYEAAKKLAKSEGYFVGISSGAALSVALKLANLDENKDKNIVVICADSGTRYLSVEEFI